MDRRPPAIFFPLPTQTLYHIPVTLEGNCTFRMASRNIVMKKQYTSAVARPNGQPRQAGVARGVRGHAPPPRNFEL